MKKLIPLFLILTCTSSHSTGPDFENTFPYSIEIELLNDNYGAYTHVIVEKKLELVNYSGCILSLRESVRFRKSEIGVSPEKFMEFEKSTNITTAEVKINLSKIKSVDFSGGGHDWDMSKPIHKTYFKRNPSYLALKENNGAVEHIAVFSGKNLYWNGIKDSGLIDNPPEIIKKSQIYRTMLVAIRDCRK